MKDNGNDDSNKNDPLNAAFCILMNFILKTLKIGQVGVEVF